MACWELRRGGIVSTVYWAVLIFLGFFFVNWLFEYRTGNQLDYEKTSHMAYSLFFGGGTAYQLNWFLKRYLPAWLTTFDLTEINEHRDNSNNQ